MPQGTSPAKGDDAFIDDMYDYWWHAGQRIIGSYGRILDASGRPVRDVSADSLMTTALKRHFSALATHCVRANPRKRCLFAEYAGAAAGRMLFIVQPFDPVMPPVTRSGVLVYSIQKRAVIAAITLPYPARTNGAGSASVQLTPDGRRVVAEPAAMTRFDIYDAQSGAPLHSLHPSPPVAPNASYFALAPDGKTLYYQAKSRVYAADLLGKKPAQALPVKSWPSLGLFFADH